MSRPQWLRQPSQPAPEISSPRAEACDVLFVCTGNICRSAYGELRLADLRPDLTVGSAGIGAVIGADVDRPMAALLPPDRNWPAHSARQATVPILMASSLILAMEDHHVAWIIETAPASATRTFTLRQLARLVAADPPPSALPANLLAKRYAQAAGEVHEGDGIDDPYRRSQQRYAQAAAEIDAALSVIAPLLQPTEMQAS